MYTSTSVPSLTMLRETLKKLPHTIDCRFHRFHARLRSIGSYLRIQPLRGGLGMKKVCNKPGLLLASLFHSHFRLPLLASLLSHFRLPTVGGICDRRHAVRRGLTQPSCYTKFLAGHRQFQRQNSHNIRVLYKNFCMPSRISVIPYNIGLGIPLIT